MGEWSHFLDPLAWCLPGGHFSWGLRTAWSPQACWEAAWARKWAGTSAQTWGFSQQGLPWCQVQAGTVALDLAPSPLLSSPSPTHQVSQPLCHVYILCLFSLLFRGGGVVFSLERGIRLWLP